MLGLHILLALPLALAASIFQRAPEPQVGDGGTCITQNGKQLSIVHLEHSSCLSRLLLIRSESNLTGGFLSRAERV